MINSEFEEKKRPDAEVLELIPLEGVDGGTCRAYKAKIYGKWIFIKELKEEFRNNPRLEEAFRKEAETGFRLDHPNLARYVLFDGLLPTGNFVAMEYVDGETLDAFLKKNPSYFSNIRNLERFVSEMSSVLDYLHSNQVLHLDIKPENVMITRVGKRVKLIDLGYCHTDSFQDSAGFTNPYRAPEREDGENGKRETADFYGLGKLLEYIRRHTEGYPTRRFRRLENALLERNPELRPADRESVERHLKKGVASRLSLPMVVTVAAVLLGGVAFLVINGFFEEKDNIQTVEIPSTVGEMQHEESVKPQELLSVKEPLEEETEGINSGEVRNEEAVPIQKEVPAPLKESESKTEKEPKSEPKTDYQHLIAQKTLLEQELKQEIESLLGKKREAIKEIIQSSSSSDDANKQVNELIMETISPLLEHSAYYAKKYPEFTEDYIWQIMAEMLTEGKLKEFIPEI